MTLKKSALIWWLESKETSIIPFTSVLPKKNHRCVNAIVRLQWKGQPKILQAKIMAISDTHEEGMHRMRRAYEESDINSSGAEFVRNELPPAPLTNIQASDILNTLGGTSTSDNLPEASCSKILELLVNNEIECKSRRLNKEGNHRG
ncbi:hypothetical protein PV327_001616 [Microctonus hyperodae]|uniref:Uncharacterized protein n=1 Tax=Microctonus hyperodae TaxID=165561 RepID=A0AA39FDV3_MICHY|nr:hypothetical protein PV327_001616 [Microctonus hyperodae]